MEIKDFIFICVAILCLISISVAMYDLFTDTTKKFDCPQGFTVKTGDKQIVNNILYGKCTYNNLEYEIVDNEFVKVTTIKEPIIIPAIGPIEYGFIHETFSFIGKVIFFLCILWLLTNGLGLRSFEK